MAEAARAKPKPTPETQHFWDGTQAGELRLQRCDACANVYFPPRPFCPGCGGRKVSVFKASGKGTLYSYVINHRPAAPGFTPPYAIAVETPQQIAHYLGITPTWVDGTSVGGCSFMLHVRHAAAAIEAGLCKTVLITHAESGKSMIGKQPRFTPADSLNGQFEAPFGVYGPPSMFPIPVLRCMKTHGITPEQIAIVAVFQREWAAKNPRATMKAPITVEDVLNSRMIAYPFRILQCCLVTDGGGALLLTSADRARDFPNKPVYILGTSESVETPMVSQMQTFDSSRAFKVAGPLAFKEAGIAHGDVDHLMIYDPFAHLPLYGLGDLGFMPHEGTGKFIADGTTTPATHLPLLPH